MKINKDILYGIRPIEEALFAGKTINKIIIKKNIDSEILRELLIKLRQRKVKISKLPIEALNRITQKNHQGIIAFVSPINYYKVENLVPIWFEEGINAKILVMDSITDIRNFGAIARSAMFFGFQAIVLPDKNSVKVNSDAIKTSAGALSHIKVCMESNLPRTLEFLKESGFSLIAATEKAEKSISEFHTNNPLVVIVGAEDEGIGQKSLALADVKVKIPRIGKMQSLNVSVAAAIVMYEMS